jgi:hypothetical protein
MAQAPDFSSLDRASLGHLWWMLRLAGTLVAETESLAQTEPTLVTVIVDLKAALANTIELRTALLTTLNARVMAVPAPPGLWD